MAKFFLILMFTIVVDTARADEKICVQTFNTYGPWYAPALKERTKLLEDYLKHNPCDVLLLQEVWLDDHLEDLKKILGELGYQAFHFDHISLTGKMYGLVTAIKGTIEGQGFFEFEENYSGLLDYFREKFLVGKGVGILKANLEKLDREIFIVNVHLHHSSSEIRSKQINQLLTNLKQLNTERLTVILGGDFNFTQESPEFENVKGQFNLISKIIDCSYCSSNNYAWGWTNKDIDHIFVDKRTRADVYENAAAPKSWKNQFLSDHFGKKVFLRM